MNATLMGKSDARIHLLVMDTGEDPLQELVRFARTQGIVAASFSAIGAFSDAVVAWFDMESRRYERIPVAEQVEVVSMLGDIALGDDGEPVVHSHVALGRRSGAVIGGHLVAAQVRPTLEMVLIEGQRALHRRYRPAVGLALLDLGSSPG